MERENKYLSFDKRERKEGAKTDVWFIFSKSDSAVWLGQIKWYAPWRKYCFYPNSETIWDVNCLDTVSEFIEDRMLERKSYSRGDEATREWLDGKRIDL